MIYKVINKISSAQMPPDIFHNVSHLLHNKTTRRPYPSQSHPHDSPALTASTVKPVSYSKNLAPGR